MTLERVPEPELMDEPEQARAYAEADFASAHDRFVAHIGRRFGQLRGEALDLGCGPADPTVRLVRANPALAVVAVDAGPVMLSLAGERIEKEGLSDRIRLERRRLPDPSLAGRRFDVVVSNSLLHHLADPLDLWRAVAGCAKPGAVVAVMDLHRPPDLAAVDRLVAEHAGTAPPVLQADFRNSLLAAYRVSEVERQLAEAGLGGISVEALDDHHLFAGGRLG
jgi:2-polyprenyl-3-methyl-5-hydroxy-6-metoxy-1,4-benzoquinol methylase